MNSLILYMPFRRNCKQVVALIIAQEDQALLWTDQLALRLHLSICKTCPVFRRQILTMRNAMKQWRHYGSDDT
jgi:hypothetical protein